MPNSATMPEIEFTSVFSDTCVLLDYVLKQDNGGSGELLNQHPSNNVISKTVEREFDGIKERRIELVKSVLKARKKNELDEWEPPSSFNLSPNDYNWCIDLLSDLRDMRSDSDIIKFLSERERQLRNGYNELFETPDPIVDVIWSANRDAHLLSNLRREVTNDNDRKVLCDAADWSSANSENTIVTSDIDDIISARNEIQELIERNRNVGDLLILSKQEFLDADPNYEMNTST